jgi:hypothetical protein
MASVAPITGTISKSRKVNERKRLRLKVHRSTYQGLRSLARQNGMSTRRYVRRVLEAHVAADLPSGREPLGDPTVLVVEEDAVSQSPVAQPIVQA